MTDLSAPAVVAGPPRAVVVALVAAVTVLIGGTLALWAALGSAVFYEVVLAGISACF
ncbi:hypothetical protein [Rhodoplanes roseus]|uniref:hypothetical protein n=1 Tax=Rhodoplanes roseus TaxID=29409 RepID=UPI001475337E|nr:hypothetical protein [Rhodoplanes roseus]